MLLTFACRSRRLTTSFPLFRHFSGLIKVSPDFSVVCYYFHFLFQFEPSVCKLLNMSVTKPFSVELHKKISGASERTEAHNYIRMYMSFLDAHTHDNAQDELHCTLYEFTLNLCPFAPNKNKIIKQMWCAFNTFCSPLTALPPHL